MSEFSIIDIPRAATTKERNLPSRARHHIDPKMSSIDKSNKISYIDKFGG
jgi:hypothetical protein